tara:strand:+ start:5346 stop:6395 length:1050 start_codon:yes stop_codon:yes gene_type:complete
MSDFFSYISGDNSPYIIAELGSNHNGDMDIAKNLIDVAKDCGSDCVKFQSWSKDSIFSKKKYEENFFLTDDYRDRKDTNLEDIVEKYSISEDQLLEMGAYSKKLKIDCASTPFSKNEANFLKEKMEVPFIKVASMDLNNYQFLDYVARLKKPIVLSTGLSELSEIDKAIRTIESTGNQEIIILHCVAIYPTPEIDIHLNNIKTLQRLYPYPIGFSDHSLGISISLAAVALGARVIEKHFTLDNSMSGWDHEMSINPDELNLLCTESKRVYKSLGSKRIVSPESDERKQEFRRSIVVSHDLKEGHKISNEDVDFKRPATGILPSELEYVLGRTLKRDLGADEIINWEDLI